MCRISEITQNNGHYTVQGHLRSSLSVMIVCDFLQVNDTNINVHPISHRFRDIADYWFNVTVDRCLSLTHSVGANP